MNQWFQRLGRKPEIPEISSVNSPSQAPGWRTKLASGTAGLLIAGGGSLPLIGWIGGDHWFLNLFNHFQAQYFVFLLLCCILLLIRRRFRLALLAAGFLFVPAIRLAPLWIPPAPSGEATLRVATFNVLGSNERYAETVDWLRRERPDIVYLCETTGSWVEALRELEDVYPLFIEETRTGNLGCVLLSRFPAEEMRVAGPGALEIPLIDLVVITPDGPVRVLGAHPVPPVSPFWAREHTTYMRALSNAAAKAEDPTLILGDLNSSPWCHQLQPILDGGYRESARGRGYSATWLRKNPLLALPIDHVLSRDAGPCLSRRLGPELGSDHRPVVAGFDLSRR